MTRQGFDRPRPMAPGWRLLFTASAVLLILAMIGMVRDLFRMVRDLC